MTRSPDKSRFPCYAPLPLLLVCLCVGLVTGCDDVDAEPAPGLLPRYYVVPATERPRAGQFLRYRAPDRNGGGLDVAITEYEASDGGPTVVLIGVVHVADAPYFVSINEALAGCDIVLWEGVKPAGMSASKWQARSHNQDRDGSGLQRQLATWFGFVFQLDAIDYAGPKFVHADMSLEDFVAAGGGDFIDISDFSGESDEFEPDDAATDRERLPGEVNETWEAVIAFGEFAMSKPSPLRSLARRMFAETMGSADLGNTLDMLPGLSELLLEKRNAVVIEKLEDLLPTSQGRIGIFYGAAHMTGLEAELTGRLGYRRTTARWLRAWAVRPPLKR